MHSVFVHLFLSLSSSLSLSLPFLSHFFPTTLITYKHACNQQHHQPQETMCILPCIPSGQRYSSVMYLCYCCRISFGGGRGICLVFIQSHIKLESAAMLHLSHNQTCVCIQQAAPPLPTHTHTTVALEL